MEKSQEIRFGNIRTPQIIRGRHSRAWVEEHYGIMDNQIPPTYYGLEYAIYTVVGWPLDRDPSPTVYQSSDTAVGYLVTKLSVMRRKIHQVFPHLLPPLKGNQSRPRRREFNLTEIALILRGLEWLSYQTDGEGNPTLEAQRLKDMGIGPDPLEEVFRIFAGNEGQFRTIDEIARIEYQASLKRES